MRELIVDNFAGGGGASLGIQWGLGRSPDIAVNHDAAAIAMHAANHPETRHFCESVWTVDPRAAVDGRRVALAWFSPDCKHFSRAKGAKPVDKAVRGLAWVAIKWAKLVKPRVIILENVREFQDWGPLNDDNRPDPARKGLTFRRFVGNLRNLGYLVEWREMNAADYGAPTHRKRFFLVARCDGESIVWPTPTHGKGLLPYRTAAECIDWSIPCPSIFGRAKPLAEKTLRRIANGIRKYVMESSRPFIVPFLSERDGQAPRVRSVDDPLQTVTSSNPIGLCAPTIVKINHGGHDFRTHSVTEPLTTILGHHGHALVSACLVQSDNQSGRGAYTRDPRTPLGTIVSKNHDLLVSAFLTKFYGTSVGSDLFSPLPTVTSQGGHIAEVRAFLVKYYGTDERGQSLFEPLHTVVARDRFGIVTVEGQDFQIADIGMRMLNPRELARAQSFPDSYILTGSKANQVARIGNSVPPVMAQVLAQANVQLASADMGVA